MSIKSSAMAGLVIIMILGSILGSCSSAAAEPSWYQKVSTNLKAMQPTDAPDHLWPIDGARNGTEFDVNRLFTVLTHLSMQEGYVLDYVYLSDGTAGGPILYIRAADTAPFKSYAEYQEATQQNPKTKNDNSLIWFVKDTESSSFGNKISVDGTKEGYFEYAMLQLVGNKFYLHGFTTGTDKRFVCDPSEVDNIITNLEKTGALDNNFKKDARKLDLKPDVAISESEVTVSAVTFSPLEGFVRDTVNISRNYPNYIIGINSDELLAVKTSK
jgi:hypothetical protein